jgi:hypothetical protein
MLFALATLSGNDTKISTYGPSRCEGASQPVVWAVSPVRSMQRLSQTPQRAARFGQIDGLRLARLTNRPFAQLRHCQFDQAWQGIGRIRTG